MNDNCFQWFAFIAPLCWISNILFALRLILANHVAIQRVNWQQYFHQIGWIQIKTFIWLYKPCTRGGLRLVVGTCMRRATRMLIFILENAPHVLSWISIYFFFVANLQCPKSKTKNEPHVRKSSSRRMMQISLLFVLVLKRSWLFATLTTEMWLLFAVWYISVEIMEWF